MADAIETFKLTAEEMAELAGEGASSAPAPAGQQQAQQEPGKGQNIPASSTASTDEGQAQTPLSTDATEGTSSASVQEAQKKFVPLEALHEARIETKELKAQLTEAQRRIDQLAALKAEVDAMRQERLKATTPQAPDYDSDPIGYNRWAIGQQQQELAELKAANAMTTQEREAQAVQRQVINTVVAKEREFSAKTPDYNAAVDYMKAFRRAELEEYGVTDPVTVQNQIAQNAYEFSTAALQMGKNPAELMYNLAKRYGYKPQVSAAKSTVDTLGSVQAGQQAGKSLTQAGGTPPVLNSAEALLGIKDPVEFEKTWAKVFGTA